MTLGWSSDCCGSQGLPAPETWLLSELILVVHNAIIRWGVLHTAATALLARQILTRLHSVPAPVSGLLAQPRVWLMPYASRPSSNQVAGLSDVCPRRMLPQACCCIAGDEDEDRGAVHRCGASAGGRVAARRNDGAGRVGAVTLDLQLHIQ